MAGPAATVARSAIEPAVTVALEQSLTRLPVGATWPARPTARFLASGSTSTATARRSVESQTAAHGQRGDASPAGGVARAEAKPVAFPARSGTAPGTRIGVISDNHGYLDPAVLEIFAGVSHIVHAGDVMDPGILDRLATVAPVTAVAGNMDAGRPTSMLPREAESPAAGPATSDLG